MVRNVNRLGLDEESSNVFFVRCDRHDKDRIEIKIGFDGLVQDFKRLFRFQIDFLLFTPKTLGLTDFESIDILKNEFQSYFRLHSFSGLSSSGISANLLLGHIKELATDLSSKKLQNLAIELDGFVKGQKRKLKKMLLQFKIDEKNKEAIEKEIQDLQEVMLQFRRLLDLHKITEINGESEKDPLGLRKELFLMNEYISHLYTNILYDLQSLAGTLKNKDPLCKLIKNLVLNEFKMREKFDLYVEDIKKKNPRHAHEDFYLRRISLLKKYFHKPLYVKTKTSFREGKLLIPVYGMAAALAAAWAIMVQLYAVNNAMQRVGINTIAFISIGVMAYVAKDIMKDFFRKFFFERSRKWFPDFENRLYIKKSGKIRRLGSVAESIRTFESKELESDLTKARYKGEVGNLEKILGEDVLHYRKKVKINLNFLEKEKRFPWGFREILRYRFDRLMVSMEDAYKRLPTIRSDGSVELKEGHRVYQVHLAIQVKPIGKESQNLLPKIRAYKVTLDKNGILDCSPVEWDQSVKIENF